MGVDTLDESQKFKDEGNAAFKEGKWEVAIDLYTQAIKVSPKDSRDLAVYYKNRAAANLKVENYKKALYDCDKSLGIVPTDPKALFRRCQALEQLERFEEAYRDARQVLNVDPGNKTIQPILERLHVVVQERMKKNSQITTKVESMIQIAFDLTADKEKRETAMNNLLVLARENAGSEIMMKMGVVLQVKKLLKVEKNKEIYVTGKLYTRTINHHISPMCISCNSKFERRICNMGFRRVDACGMYRAKYSYTYRVFKQFDKLKRKTNSNY